MGRLDQEYIRRCLKAAEKGEAKAFYDLGLHYSTGNGVPLDYVEAHKWFNLAAVCGLKRAKIDRAEIARDMSTAEIAEAQRQAREWMQHR